MDEDARCNVVTMVLVGGGFSRGAGDHRHGFSQQVCTMADSSWSTDVGDVQRSIRERRMAGAATVKGTFPRAANLIESALARLR